MADYYHQTYFYRSTYSENTFHYQKKPCGKIYSNPDTNKMILI